MSWSRPQLPMRCRPASPCHRRPHHSTPPAPAGSASGLGSGVQARQPGSERAAHRQQVALVVKLGGRRALRADHHPLLQHTHQVVVGGRHLLQAGQGCRRRLVGRLSRRQPAHSPARRAAVGLPVKQARSASWPALAHSSQLQAAAAHGGALTRGGPALARYSAMAACEKACAAPTRACADSARSSSGDKWRCTVVSSAVQLQGMGDNEGQRQWLGPCAPARQHSPGGPAISTAVQRCHKALKRWADQRCA